MPRKSVETDADIARLFDCGWRLMYEKIRKNYGRDADIARAYRAGIQRSELAKRYGVSTAAIDQAIKKAEAERKPGGSVYMTHWRRAASHFETRSSGWPAAAFVRHVGSGISGGERPSLMWSGP